MNGDVVVVLDRTPSFAESGGQVGDTGFLTQGRTVRCFDTTKLLQTFLHITICGRGGTGVSSEGRVRDGQHTKDNIAKP